jgi:hypothetical protein
VFFPFLQLHVKSRRAMLDHGQGAKRPKGVSPQIASQTLPHVQTLSKGSCHGCQEEAREEEKG